MLAGVALLLLVPWTLDQQTSRRHEGQTAHSIRDRCCDFHHCVAVAGHKKQYDPSSVMCMMVDGCKQRPSISWAQTNIFCSRLRGSSPVPRPVGDQPNGDGGPIVNDPVSDAMDPDFDPTGGSGIIDRLL